MSFSGRHGGGGFDECEDPPTDAASDQAPAEKEKPNPKPVKEPVPA